MTRRKDRDVALCSLFMYGICCHSDVMFAFPDNTLRTLRILVFVRDFVLFQLHRLGILDFSGVIKCKYPGPTPG